MWTITCYFHIPNITIWVKFPQNDSKLFQINAKLTDYFLEVKLKCNVHLVNIASCRNNEYAKQIRCFSKMQKPAWRNNQYAKQIRCFSKMQKPAWRNNQYATDSLFLQNAKASCGSELDRTGHACDFTFTFTLLLLLLLTCAVMQEVMQVMKVDLMRPW